MNQEDYSRILDFATHIIQRGYAPGRTFDHVIDDLISAEYDRAQGILPTSNSILPSIDVPAENDMDLENIEGKKPTNLT